MTWYGFLWAAVAAWALWGRWRDRDAEDRGGWWMPLLAVSVPGLYFGPVGLYWMVTGDVP